MLRRRSDTWLIAMLIAAAFVGLVAHVCVAPLHAHAVPIDGHGSHDDDAAAHSVHTASCEAVKSGVSLAAPAPPPEAAVVLSPPFVSAFRRPGAPADLATAESPPLFLLHASLLI